MAGGEAFLDSFWTARREQKQQWWSGCPGDRDARQNDAEDSTITFGWNFSVALLVRRQNSINNSVPVGPVVAAVLFGESAPNRGRWCCVLPLSYSSPPRRSSLRATDSGGGTARPKKNEDRRTTTASCGKIGDGIGFMFVIDPCVPKLEYHPSSLTHSVACLGFNGNKNNNQH